MFVILKSLFLLFWSVSRLEALSMFRCLSVLALRIQASYASQTEHNIIYKVRSISLNPDIQPNGIFVAKFAKLPLGQRVDLVS